MKRKLIAIALIALLVLTVAPIAATAQVPQQRHILTAPVFFGKQDPTTYVWTLSRFPVGMITINFDTGRWSYLGVWLPKGDYFVGITSINTGFGTSIAVGSVTSHGLFLVRETGNTYGNPYIQYAYNLGNSFFIGKWL
jgi:hypothetical protein